MARIFGTQIQVLDGFVEAQLLVNGRGVSALLPHEFSTTLSTNVLLGTSGAVRSFRKAFQPDRDEPIKASEVAREFERLNGGLFEQKGGPLRKDAVENGYGALIVALHSLCTHFSVTSVRLEKASVKNGVMALLQLLRPTSLELSHVLSG